MTLTAEYVQEIMHSSIGSMRNYKRAGSKYMDYTEGVMEFQQRCSAYWFIDLMYSHMPSVLEDFKETEESIYFVTLDIKEDSTAYFKIVREYYDYEAETEEDEVREIIVAEQEIPYTDLPATTLKFYLELASYEPLLFRLLCPSEH